MGQLQQEQTEQYSALQDENRKLKVQLIDIQLAYLNQNILYNQLQAEKLVAQRAELDKPVTRQPIPSPEFPAINDSDA